MSGAGLGRPSRSVSVRAQSLNRKSYALRITAITRAGTGSVTVNYTNTLPGTNYVLAYGTNLSTTNWLTGGAKKAAGTSDSQTDGSATNSQRHYRVYHP